MKIYGDLGSGNCLKVKFVADYLGLPYQWQDVDIMRGESRTPEFLDRNPQGQVPLVELDDGRCLAQSNAIIRYLAAGTVLLSEDRYEQAKVDEWLFWEQYSHEPYVAVCRFHMVYLARPREAREAWRVERGEAALDYLEAHLQAGRAAGRDWLAGECFSIADVALLPYTQMAPEGGFELATRPAIRTWVERAAATLRL